MIYRYRNLASAIVACLRIYGPSSERQLRARIRAMKSQLDFNWNFNQIWYWLSKLQADKEIALASNEWHALPSKTPIELIGGFQ